MSMFYRGCFRKWFKWDRKLSQNYSTKLSMTAEHFCMECDFCAGKTQNRGKKQRIFWIEKFQQQFIIAQLYPNQYILFYSLVYCGKWSSVDCQLLNCLGCLPSSMIAGQSQISSWLQLPLVSALAASVWSEWNLSQTSFGTCQVSTNRKQLITWQTWGTRGVHSCEGSFRFCVWWCFKKITCTLTC